MSETDDCITPESTDDVYLSLRSLSRGGIVSLEVSVFPLMWLLWFGGGVTVIGGLIALRATRRTREPRPRVASVT